MAPWRHPPFWLIVAGVLLLLGTYGAFVGLPHHVQKDMPIEGNTAPQGRYWHEDEPEHYEEGETLDVRWKSSSSILVGMARMKDAEGASGNLSRLKLIGSDEGRKGSFTFTAPEDGRYAIIVGNAEGDPTGWIYMDRSDRVLTGGHVCGMVVGVIMTLLGTILLYSSVYGSGEAQQGRAGSTGEGGTVGQDLPGEVQRQQQWEQTSQQYPVCPSCNVYLDQYGTCPQCGRGWG